MKVVKAPVFIAALVLSACDGPDSNSTNVNAEDYYGEWTSECRGGSEKRIHIYPDPIGEPRFFWSLDIGCNGFPEYEADGSIVFGGRDHSFQALEYPDGSVKVLEYVYVDFQDVQKVRDSLNVEYLFFKDIYALFNYEGDTYLLTGVKQDRGTLPAFPRYTLENHPHNIYPTEVNIDTWTYKKIIDPR